MERNLVDMFRGLHESYKLLESRLKAEGYKVRIMKIFRTWEEWAVYSRDFLLKLQNTFLGIQIQEDNQDGQQPSSDHEDDIDGVPVPLDGAALLKGALMRGIPTPEHTDEDDIDGVPCKLLILTFLTVNFFNFSKFFDWFFQNFSDRYFFKSF